MVSIDGPIRRPRGALRAEASRGPPRRRLTTASRSARRQPTRGHGALRQPDPRARRAVRRGAPRAAAVRPGPPVGAGVGQGLRRRRGRGAGARQPRLLADRRAATPSAFERELAALHRRSATRCSSTPARRPTCSRSTALTSPQLGDRRAPARRRGHHRRGRLPDHGQPDRPERPRAGLRRRRRCRPTTSTPTQLEAARRRRRTRAIMIAHTLGNPFDLDAVTALCRAARPVARRGLLRRARLDLPRPARRHVRRPRDAQLLPRPPHHDGRGRRGPDQPRRRSKRIVESFRDWGRDCWCEPGERQHLRQALRLAARRRCRTATTTSTSTRHLGYNLKATDMQAAIGVAQLAQARRLRRRAPRATTRYLRAALADLDDVPDPARGDAGHGPELVRLRAHRARRARRSTRRDLVALPRGAAASPPACCSAATCCASPPTPDVPHRVAGDLATTDLVAERHLLGRLLSRPRRAHLEHVRPAAAFCARRLAA